MRKYNVYIVVFVCFATADFLLVFGRFSILLSGYSTYFLGADKQRESFFFRFKFKVLPSLKVLPTV